VLEPIVAPTVPAVVPGYVQLDEATGLHMTGDYQVIDVITWTLEITGAVETPLILTYDDLRCMPKIEQRCVLNCPGFFQDEATWAGASLQHILDLAGVKPTLEGIYLYSVDGYRTFVTAAGLEAGDGFLAYEWEGEPVPILHGFPVRAVFPALDGNKWSKWLVKIEVK
jgi:DMSO/TMAO reductase YedYZ molybdopterin-dependent catalytic subunit